MSNTPRSSFRAAVIMFLYGGIVVGLSSLAFVIAPEGANASTALIMGGASAFLMVVMGVLALLLPRNRKAGMVGIHLGLLLPLLFAVAFFMRISANYQSAGVHSYFYSAYEQAVNEGEVADTFEARNAFLDGGRNAVGGEEIPEYSKAYLGQILTLLFGVSLGAFALLLGARPTVQAAEATHDQQPAKEADGSIDPFG
ncbi:MAG: hypothetical protein AAGF47_07635 [Planctomycetota bacterium]